MIVLKRVQKSLLSTIVSDLKKKWLWVRSLPIVSIKIATLGEGIIILIMIFTLHKTENSNLIATGELISSKAPLSFEFDANGYYGEMFIELVDEQSGISTE